MKDFKRVFHGALVTGLGGVVAMATLTGCGMWEGRKARESGRTVTQYQNDKRTSERVSDALKAEPVYKFPDVHVDAYNGTVQLSGFVHNDGQKQQAEKVAKDVPGVRQVMDNLAVVPENVTPTGRIEGYPQNTQQPNIQTNQFGQPSNQPADQTVPPPR